MSTTRPEERANLPETGEKIPASGGTTEDEGVKKANKKAAEVGAEGVFEEVQAKEEPVMGMTKEEFNKVMDLVFAKEELQKLRSGGQYARHVGLINPRVREHNDRIDKLESVLKDPDNVRLLNTLAEFELGLTPRYPESTGKVSVFDRESLKNERAYYDAVFEIDKKRLDTFKELSPEGQAELLRREMVIIDGDFGNLNKLRKELGTDVVDKLFRVMAMERAATENSGVEIGGREYDALRIKSASDLLSDAQKVLKRFKEAGSVEALKAMPPEAFAEREYQIEALEKARTTLGRKEIPDFIRKPDEEEVENWTRFFAKKKSETVEGAKILEEK